MTLPKIVMNAIPQLRPWDVNSFDNGRVVAGPSQVTDAYLRGFEAVYFGGGYTMAGLFKRMSDEEAGNNLIAQGLRIAAERGTFFLENYCWAAWRAGSVLDEWYPTEDQDKQYRNADWVKVGIDKFLTDEFDEQPDWWKEYDPAEMKRDSWYRMPTHLAFGSNPPFPRGEEEEYTPPIKGGGTMRIRSPRGGARTPRLR